MLVISRDRGLHAKISKRGAGRVPNKKRIRAAKGILNDDSRSIPGKRLRSRIDISRTRPLAEEKFCRASRPLSFEDPIVIFHPPKRHLHCPVVILAIPAFVSRTALGRFSFPSTILAPSRASSRLSLIQRHLDQRPPLPSLNTPYSAERGSDHADDLPYTPLIREVPKRYFGTSSAPKMADRKTSNQPAHPSLLIPGPIEFDDAVLDSMSHYA